MNMSAYHKATGQFIPEVETPKEEDAEMFQLRNSWKMHPYTHKLFSDMSLEITECINQAILRSVSYPQHQDHNQIIQLLVRADTLRKVKEKYA